MAFLQRLLEGRNQATLEGQNTHGAAILGSGSRVTVETSTALAAKGARISAEAGEYVAIGRYGDALAILTAALAPSPDDPDLLFARAETLFSWGRFREAVEGALRAEASGARHPRLEVVLGWSFLATGSPDKAEESMRKAVAAEPHSWTTNFGLAAVLQARERLDEAAASLERALELRPDSFECTIDLGGCRLNLDDPAAAEAHFRRAIELGSNRAAAWTMLGAALTAQSRYGEALDAHEHATLLAEATSQGGDSFVHFAINLRESARTQESFAVYERNLPQWPDAYGHFSYGVALLSAGRLREGWPYYEFRWLTPCLLPLRAAFQRPVWSGQDLRGKTILLRSEQGIGDTIQLVRFAPLVKALGASVVLKVRDELVELLRGLAGVDRVCERGEALPEFDYYAYLLSVPGVLETDLASIPADVPYLCADSERVESWRARFSAGGALRVGLVWAGDPGHQVDRYRSLPLRSLEVLGTVQGARFFSLQKGPAAVQANHAPAGLDLIDLGPELQDFADTAAVVSLLDLVICVDTAVAHLAGAMGKPVWLLLPTPADWRWLEVREDTPWYPTMRLFRQSHRGEWDDVVASVQTALQSYANGEGQALTDPTGNRLRGAPTVPVPVRQVADCARSCGPAGMSAVAETRLGIVQYLPDEAIVGRSIRWYGEHQQRQLEFLARMIKPGATVMEVGAGVGMHALFLARAIGAGGHLLLYEARPVLQRVLRQNLAANRVGNVTVMRRSLGAALGSACAKDGGLSIAAPSRTATTDATPTETLDELQLERLDWLKINDGVVARDVLGGAMDSLWRLRPLLFIAAPDEVTLTSLGIKIKEFSYRCWRMETALFNPGNFYGRDGDIFSGRTALSLLAIPEEVDVDMALEGCVELL